MSEVDARIRRDGLLRWSASAYDPRTGRYICVGVGITRGGALRSLRRELKRQRQPIEHVSL